VGWRAISVRVRYISDGPLKGQYNMGIDEAIQRAVGRGEVLPTVRFYQWDPACLSLGYFQDVNREVNLAGLREAKVDLVRRSTGGKAVLHDDELTYSVVILEKDLRGSVLETYCEISRALAEGLRRLGLPAQMAALERGVSARDPRFRQAACFSAPSWFEITVHQKKIIGSAQNRKNGVILQHGSIPFHFDAQKLVGCLRTSSQEHASRAALMLARKALGVSQALGREVSRKELEAAICTGFEAMLGWEIEPGELTASERSESARLAEEKYGSRKWTMERGKLNEELYRRWQFEGGLWCSTSLS
jgi:lipoate-protein ligase A